MERLARRKRSRQYALLPSRPGTSFLWRGKGAKCVFPANIIPDELLPFPLHPCHYPARIVRGDLPPSANGRRESRLRWRDPGLPYLEQCFGSCGCRSPTCAPHPRRGRTNERCGCRSTRPPSTCSCSRRYQHASVNRMHEPPFRSAAEWGNIAAIPWRLKGASALSAARNNDAIRKRTPGERSSIVHRPPMQGAATKALACYGGRGRRTGIERSPVCAGTPWGTSFPRHVMMPGV